MTYNNAKTPSEYRRIRYLKAKGLPLDYQKPRQRTNGHASRALNKDEYAQLVTLQDGRCWVCRAPHLLVVDHDHYTGVLRGLLCPACNMSLQHSVDLKCINKGFSDYISNPPALRLFTIKLPLDMKGRSERIL